MPSHERNHVVAKGYLMGFADTDGFLLQYDKLGQQPEEFQRVHVSTAAVKKRFYWLRNVPDGERLKMEHDLDRLVEAPGMQVIQKLRRWSGVGSEERATLGRFMGMQFTRVPRFRSAMQERHDEMWTKNQETHIARYDRIFAQHSDRSADGWKESRQVMHEWHGQMVAGQNAIMYEDSFLEDLQNDSILRQMWSEGHSLGEYLKERRWLVLHPEPFQQLVTSDNPMQLSNDAPDDPVELMPLSRDCLLGLYQQGKEFAHVRPGQFGLNLIAECNRLTMQNAERFVYGQNEGALRQAIEAAAL